MKIQLFPALADDLLDADSLPRTDKTQLNYRTRPLSPGKELRITLLILLAPVPTLISLSAVVGSLVWLHRIFEHVVFSATVLMSIWLALRALAGASVRYAVAASTVFASAYIGCKIWDWISQAPTWSCRAAVLLAWLTSSLVARQVAAELYASPSAAAPRAPPGRKPPPLLDPLA